MIRSLLALLLLGFVSVAEAAPLPRSNGGCTLGNLLPLDAGVPGITAAYGTCALKKAWLNRHFADVVANGVTYTINFINGIPDTRRLAQLMGNINPNFGIGGLPLAKWYDQSGNGNDCLQTTAANRMSVWLVNGHVSINTDGYLYKFITGGTALDRYCSAASVSTNGRASTFYFAGHPYQLGAPGYNTTGVGVYFQTGPGCCGGGAGAGFQLGGGGSNNNAANFGAFDWDTFSSSTFPQLWPESQPSVLGYIMGATNVTVTQNEESTVCAGTCPLSAQTPAGLTIGADVSNPGQGAYAGFQGVLVFGSTALSSGNQTTIRNALYQLFNIAKTQNYSVIVDGASFDIGQGSLVGAVQGFGWHEQMRSRTPYPVRLVNIAVSGLTIAQLNTVWSNMSAFPCTGSFSKVILIGPNSAAGNSINNGETGAQAFADLQTYLTTVKSKCTWSAIIVATLPTGGATSGPNFDYNTLVRANAASLGYIVADWAADPVMGPNSNLNPVLYNQVNPYGLHPTVAGHSYLATDMLGPLRAAIGQ